MRPSIIGLGSLRSLPKILIANLTDYSKDMMTLPRERPLIPPKICSLSLATTPIVSPIVNYWGIFKNDFVSSELLPVYSPPPPWQVTSLILIRIKFQTKQTTQVQIRKQKCNYVMMTIVMILSYFIIPNPVTHFITHYNSLFADLNTSLTLQFPMKVYAISNNNLPSPPPIHLLLYFFGMVPLLKQFPSNHSPICFNSTHPLTTL